MSTRWWLYVLDTAIDFGWGQLLTLTDYLDIRGQTVARRGLNETAYRARILGELFTLKEHAAATLGYDGELRDEEHVFVVPNNDGSTSHGFVWKQENNGTCFVASPIAMDFSMAGRRPPVVTTP